MGVAPSSSFLREQKNASRQQAEIYWAKLVSLEEIKHTHQTL
jgi:hypothetical protein